VAARLEAARRRIEAAGGDPEAVRVVAVTKGFGPEAVSAAAAAGLVDIGENYAQELTAKAAAVAPLTEATVRWHFLGALQRNKVRSLAPLVSLWQSVARLEEGIEISRRAPGAEVLVEVDTSGVAGRNGCTPGETPGLVSELAGLDLAVRGLMTVAPQDPDAAAASFRTVRSLADQLGLVERSMGMSDDMESAVTEGSTMVRLGRALFGDRPPRQPATQR
jgi:pyridoxal phosphate enzyme (YggS family)